MTFVSLTILLRTKTRDAIIWGRSSLNIIFFLKEWSLDPFFINDDKLYYQQ